MKRFIFTIIGVSAFFVGVGAVAHKVKAVFKSDEKAVIILKRSQVAIGGENKIRTVKSLSVNGRVVSVFSIDGAEQTREGNLQIRLSLPDKFRQMEELRFPSDGQTDPIMLKEKGPAEGREKDILEKIKAAEKEKEKFDFLRTMFSLFFTTPDQENVTYQYRGDSDIDGQKADIVEASAQNKPIAKLYINQATNLPLMVSYRGDAVPKFVELKKMPGTGDGKDVLQELRKAEKSEYQIKFSDYRPVNGLLLPFSWVQIADGKPDKTITIENYEFNPANIEDSFKPQEIRVRTPKP